MTPSPVTSVSRDAGRVLRTSPQSWGGNDRGDGQYHTADRWLMAMPVIMAPGASRALFRGG